MIVVRIAIHRFIHVLLEPHESTQKSHDPARNARNGASVSSTDAARNAPGAVGAIILDTFFMSVSQIRPTDHEDYVLSSLQLTWGVQVFLVCRSFDRRPQSAAWP